MNNSPPPQRALRFLRWFCRDEYLEEIEGNLLEMYEKQQAHSPRQAKWQFVIRVLFHFRPAFIRSFKSYSLISTAMLQHSFLVAIRLLWKQKGYTLLNILGLTTGLTTSLLILLWVQFELSYDTMHTQADQIYKVNTHFEMDGGLQSWPEAPAALGPFAKRTLPEVQQVVRIRENWNYVDLIQYKDNFFYGDVPVYIDPSFFTVFDFPLLKGDIKNPFPSLNSVILTESVAQKIFGKEDPLEKVVQSVQSTYESEDYVVSGVIADFPENSSITFDLIFPFEFLVRKYESNNWTTPDNNWNNFGFETYLQLQPAASPTEVETKLKQLHQEHDPESENMNFYYTAQSLKDVHLYAADGNKVGVQQVRLFFIVAIVVLLIACINYVNLSTAQATQRAKEVGLKKLIGANRTQLFGQLLGESALLFIIAAMIALFLAKLLMPVYNNLAGQTLELVLLSTPVLTMLGIAFVFTLLTAGIYPALLLSAFEPLQALKGKFSIGSSNISFRKILVVMQFSFSMMLIVGTLTISKQMQYIQQKKLGYDQENVFIAGMESMYDHYEVAKAELEKLPEIASVTATNQRLTNVTEWAGNANWEGKEDDRVFLVHEISVEEDFLETMNIALVDGRGFTGSPADSAHYILNETAVAQAGIEDPIGKRFELWGIEGTIIGIAKDFHLTSIHRKIEPVVFHTLGRNWRIYVKTTPENTAEAIAAAERVWRQYNPQNPTFDYRFLDDTYDELYKSEQRTSKLFNYFTAIAMLVSCLGLFGLATFTARQRTKEIGIRKVLGASIKGIVALLSKDFLKLILVATVIASPVAWYVMHRWLQDFAYRVEIDIWVFILSGLATLLVAILTVSYQSIRAALANPVDSLRNE